MKKNKILILLLLVFSLFVCVFTFTNNEVNAATSYYSSINFNQTGVTLKNSLRTLISSTHKKTTSYDELKTYLQEADEDPNNSNNMILFYTGESVKKSADMNVWNREHVWCQSLGWFKTSGAGADMHHLRPCTPSVNSSRGNTKFGTASGYYDPSKFGVDFRGDVARIIFYLFTRYTEADNYTFTSIAQSKELLLEWNELDPVSETETIRNDYTQTIQGNRNPFIDYPECANLIWGDGSSGNAGGGNSGNEDVDGGDNNESLHGDGYTLVTSVSQLAVDKKIIIVNESNSNALSTNQRTNNRGVTSVNISNNTISDISSDVQELTLKQGTSNNTYAFYTGNGYLYAASSSSNHLKTQNTIDGNASWSISISNGEASIKANGGNTRNVMQYNPNNGTPIISCYASASQQPLSIYVRNEMSEEDRALHTFESQNTYTSLMLSYDKEETLGNDSTYSYTFSSKQYADNETLSLNGVNWILSGNGGYWGYDGSKGQQLGSGNAPYKSLILTSGTSFSNIKSITINTSGASNINGTVNVLVGGEKVGSQSLTSTATTYTFDLNNSKSGVVQFSYTQTSSKAIYIKSIAIEYSTSDSTYTLNSAKIRFGSYISKEIYDELNTNGTLWGVEYYIGSTNQWNTASVKTVFCTPAQVSSPNSTSTDPNGQYYQYALVLTGLNLSHIDTVINARVFVEYEGVRYYMNQKSASLRDVAGLYLSSSDKGEFSEHLGILNYIKNYN